MSVLLRNSRFVFSEIHPRLWLLTFYWPVTVNVWFWKESDGLTLVDAAQPWNAADILEAAKRVGVDIARVVVTHAHPDHAGAAAAVTKSTGASVFAHACEADYLRGTRCMADEPGFWLCRALLGAGNRLGILNPPPVEHVAMVDDGARIGSLRVLHTPGHTPGSISLWSEQTGVLFCGDNISNRLGFLRLNFSHFTLDNPGLRKSLWLYEALPAKVICPGHGPPHRSEHASADVVRLLGKRPN